MCPTGERTQAFLFSSAARPNQSNPAALFSLCSLAFSYDLLQSYQQHSGNRWAAVAMNDTIFSHLNVT